jgi:hypothetical protein
LISVCGFLKRSACIEVLLDYKSFSLLFLYDLQSSNYAMLLMNNHV